MVGPGDVTWALQWDFALAPGSTFLISKIKDVQIPEPSAAVLVSLGLIAFALQQAGIPRDDPAQRQALAWLIASQNKTEGFWPSSSLNKNEEHHLAPATARFMNDAATAYAVLALTEANRH